MATQTDFRPGSSWPFPSTDPRCAPEGMAFAAAISGPHSPPPRTPPAPGITRATALPFDLKRD